MWTRMWTRRVLDEEELLASMVPQQFKGESLTCRDRYDVEQWLTSYRITEGSNEVHGVEALLGTLTGPLKVVYTVALDEVKQFISR